jgi:TNF receptor-associated protein 1
MFTLHFRADAPIDLKCLLYVPSFHTEKFGMGRIEPGEGRSDND